MKHQSSVLLAFSEVTGGFPSRKASNAENISMSSWTEAFSQFGVHIDSIPCFFESYRQTSNIDIRRITSKNSNVSRLVLQLVPIHWSQV